MRILHVNTTAARVGGAEVVLYHLLDWQRDRGHTVGLLAGHPREEHDEAERRIVRRPDWDGASLISDPAFQAAARAFVERFRPDVVHVHNLSLLPVRLVETLGACDVPLVHHLHDAATFCANSWLVKPDGTVCDGGVGEKCTTSGCQDVAPYDGRALLSYRLREEVVRATMDHWITTTERFAELARARGFDPVTPITLWTPGSPAATPPERSGRRVLFAGRLVREKGVDVLLRAWAQVVRRVPDAALDVVGDGPLRSELEELARSLGLDPGALFRGRVPRAEIDRRMREASALVLPSIWFEAFGLINLEAFAAGLPVVASRIGGIPEVVRDGETGLLVEPRDPDALADALVRVLTDQALHAKLVAGCLADAERRRDDAPMRQVLEVYERAIARGRAHRSRVDADLLASADAALRDYTRLEDRGRGLHKHLTYLDGESSVLRGLARHVRNRWRNKQERG